MSKNLIIIKILAIFYKKKNQLIGQVRSGQVKISNKKTDKLNKYGITTDKKRKKISQVKRNTRKYSVAHNNCKTKS